MIKNYLTIAVRNLLKHKNYSLINIFGLALGIACCLLILLYVQDELSYDSFHEKGDRIYRLLAESGLGSEIEIEEATTSFPLGPALQSTFPEVLEAVRFREGYRAVLSYGDRHFKEERFYFVDANVFDVFTFQFETGDSRMALAEPNSLVLTQSTARKYFGENDPIGEVLIYNGWGGRASIYRHRRSVRSASQHAL